MKRNIVVINEDLCNGCTKCVKGCHEGALQMIDGKARIVSELYCDGLGACIGDCPVGAITVEQREALPYDENAVMERIAEKGEKTILAHLKHLKDHNEKEYLKIGIDYIKRNNLDVDLTSLHDNEPKLGCGCPGSMARTFNAKSLKPDVKPVFTANNKTSVLESELTHWPVQLHLLNPEAGFFNDADVLLAADCTAFAFPDFHNKLLKNKKLAIACPKLDTNKEVYLEKLVSMIDSSQINTLTVAIMEVPCCSGLLQIAMKAVERASRKIPLKKIVVGVKGNIVTESWV